MQRTATVTMQGSVPGCGYCELPGSGDYDIVPTWQRGLSKLVV